MLNCSSRSCIIAPALQHLQQPRSTANDRREREQHRRHARGTRRLSGARPAAAARAWPKRVSDIQQQSRSPNPMWQGVSNRSNDLTKPVLLRLRGEKP